jgi:hypothetical protein
MATTAGKFSLNASGDLRKVRLVVCTIGIYMVTTGQIQPGQRMFLDLLAPEYWEGIEQLSGGLISLLFGAGSLYLVKMRNTSRLDDIARGKVKA